MNNEKKYIWKKKLNNSLESIEYLLDFKQLFSNKDISYLTIDFSKTLYFETNLLALLWYIFEELNSQGIKIKTILRDKKVEVDYKKCIYNMFLYYSSSYLAFLKPRLVGQNNERETEDLLIKYLKNIELREYDKIKVLISELITNIKMHTIKREGLFSGWINKEESVLVVSIVNFGVTIKSQIKNRRDMEFESDYEAIMWALKRSNSTREVNEIGGLGLYLLRRYMSELRGRYTIVSGNAFIEFDKDCFDETNENNIIYSKYKELGNKFNGNIITLFIPYELVDDREKFEKYLNEIDLSNINWRNIYELLNQVPRGQLSK